MTDLVYTDYPTNPNFKDRSGQIINGIEILKYLGQDKNFNSVYQCKCPHCGNIWDTRINGIVSGSTTGCGCMGSRTNKSTDKWESHIGETHNQLKIIGFERVWSGSRYRPHYICDCDCGKVVSVRCQQVLEGKTKSCGCLNKEVQRERLTGKGRYNQHYKTRLYRIYRRMYNCCYIKDYDRYKDYGGRGITICDEWLDHENGFNRFYDWAMGSGYSEELTIDRIDNNGKYEPSNCRWATAEIQSFNKRNTRYIGIKEEFKHIGKPDIIYCLPMGVWAKILNVPKNSLRSRINKVGNGWTVFDALTIPFTKTSLNGEKIVRRLPIIPQEYMKYNRVDLYESSIRD